MIESPCKDCPDRYLGCHDHCEKFQAFREKKAEARARMYEERRGDIEYWGSRRNSKMRAIRAMGSKNYGRFKCEE